MKTNDNKKANNTSIVTVILNEDKDTRKLDNEYNDGPFLHFILNQETTLASEANLPPLEFHL